VITLGLHVGSDAMAGAQGIVGESDHGNVLGVSQ
jgi:hypothetical protein